VAEIFLNLDLNLPLYSRLILKFALFFAKYRYFFIAAFIIILLLAIQLYKVDRVRKGLFTLLTKVPAARALVKFMDLARFTNTVSLLLRSGVPIIEVLEISRNVVVSPRLQIDIDFVKDELAKGSTLAEGMKKRPASFPSLLSRVAAVGENTGNLDQTLGNISTHYQKNFTDIVKNISVLLEPVLIVLIAVLVGAMLISIIVPIYQGIGQLTPRQGL
jgi:type II secretory pathway component PulF